MSSPSRPLLLLLCTLLCAIALADLCQNDSDCCSGASCTTVGVDYRQCAFPNKTSCPCPNGTVWYYNSCIPDACSPNPCETSYCENHPIACVQEPCPQYRCCVACAAVVPTCPVCELGFECEIVTPPCHTCPYATCVRKNGTDIDKGQQSSSANPAFRVMECVLVVSTLTLFALLF